MFDFRSCFFIIIFCFIHTFVDCENCLLLTSEIVCSNITVKSLQDNIMVEVRRKDVKHLKIANSLIEFLRRETLEDYKNLRTLTIANSGLKLVEYGAFSENLLLESFNVTNNFIQDISSKTFPSTNNIKTISLSNNLFRSLNDFDINHFPHLHTLDISKNYLEYLPEQLLNKLDNSSFTLIAGNNPFKCDDWSSKSINLCTLISKSKLQPLLINYTNVTSSANTEVKCIRHCHFLKCIPPFLCGIWLGIIIGNICKIKDLIYPKLMENKATQYDVLKFGMECTHMMQISEEKSELEMVIDPPKVKKSVSFKSEMKTMKKPN